jgi:hypothetical protein
MDYVTIASTGNATDFGDLFEAAMGFIAGTSSPTRGVFGGGLATGGVIYNTIQYITIASTGNSENFGDLTAATHSLGACSNTHGGL